MAILTTNKQIADAVKRSKANLRDEVTATGLEYSPRIDVFVLNLSDGTRCAVPREQLEGLRDAKPKQVSHFELVGGGSGIHWPDLDVDLSVNGLINGIYGSKKWMSDLGRVGGSVRSKKKAQAARLNGLKGGRPKAMAHGNRVS
jgi:Protein of unknown function (DUF2442)